MRKKGNLVEALTEFDRRPSAEHSITDAQVDTKSRSSANRQHTTKRPPSRMGKKALTAYFEPEVLKQLKLLAAKEDKTIQSLLGEAINELFKKYGKPHIA